MAVETSAVQISVNVVDNTSSQVLAGVEQNLTKMGAAGTRSGKQVEEGMKAAGAGMLSAKEKTRLAAEEIGVRLPRAMISLIGECKTAQVALNALSTVMIGFATIQIGAMVFEAAIRGAEKLWNNYFSLNSAAEDYEKTVKKQKDDDYWNSHDIETTTLRINEAKNAVEAYGGAANAIHKQGWVDILSGNVGTGLGELYGAHQMAGEGVKNRERADKLSPEQERQQHENRLAQIELEHAGDARLRGERKITAEKQKQHAINVEDASYKYGLDSANGNPVAKDAAEKEQNTKNRIADAKADAELFNLRRGQSQELAHIREQALETGLHGVALYEAQEAAAIVELKFKDMDSTAARYAVHAKFHAEKMKWLRAEMQATDKIERQAGTAGLTGISKTRAEGANRIADINEDPNLDDANRARRIAAVNRQTDAEILEGKRALTVEVDALSDQSAMHQISGFARITAEASRKIDELREKIRKEYGYAPKIGPLTTDQAEGKNLLDRGTASINQGSDAERAALQRKNSDETVHLEEQARVKFLSAEKQKTAAIGAELEERKQKYLEELNTQEISQDDYNRRVAAAQMEANGQMIEAATEARKKMAGEFSEIFEGMNHPLKYLQKLGDKAAGNAAASLVQRFQGKGPDRTPDGAFSDVFSGGGHGGKNAQRGGGGTHAEAGKMFSVNSATIQIGTATIAGGGAGMGPGGSGTSAVGPGGSTTLLAPGTTGATGGMGAGGSSTSAGAAAWSAGGSTASGADAGSSTVGGAGTGGGAEAGAHLASGAAGALPGKGGFWKGLGSDISGGLPLAKEFKDMFHKKGTGQQQQSDYLLKHLFHHQAEAGASGDLGGAGSGGPRAADGRRQSTQMPVSNGAPGATAQGNLSSAGSLVQTIKKSKDGDGSGSGSGSSSSSDKVMNGVGEGITAGQDAVGLYSAHEGGGSFGGAMKGAASGAELGLMVAGPIGMVVGAVAGAAIGAIGSSAAARQYDLKTVRPRIANDLSSYQSGGMSYLDAYSDAQSLQMEASKAISKMGWQGDRYYQNTIKPEIKEFMGKLTAEQKGGRSMYGASGASYATGTPYVPQTGLNQNHAGERIFSSVDNSTMVKAITEGNRGKMPVQTTSMGDVHLHVHAIDAKGVSQFLDKYKHNIRSAVNDSYAENSGGGMN
jgi:hypothetical protein